MHARYYASASGRFCTADANLGSASDPLTLNRYLYCSSDPVNFVGPDGFAKVVYYKAKGRQAKSKAPALDPAAQQGRAPIPERQRDFYQIETSVAMRNNWTSARKDAWGNTVKWINERAERIEQKYGWAAREEFSRQVAQRYQKQVEAYSCGSAQGLKDFAGEMHQFESNYWYVPVAGTLVDWCAYVSERNAEMTALYSVLSLVDVLRAGSVGALKDGFRLAVGAGIKSPNLVASTAKSQIKILYRGSAGRTEAESLLEQLAMESAKANPLEGGHACSDKAIKGREVEG